MTRPALSLAALTLLSSAVAVAVPVQVTHSGFLLDSDDAPITSLAQSMTFELYAAQAPAVGDTAIWAANCAADVRQGYYSVVLGSPSCSGGGLDSTVFADGAVRWLQVRIDGVEILPRLHLAPTPAAANAQLLEGLAASAFARASHSHVADDVSDFDLAAVNAMGAKANGNPLNHDRYTDGEAVAAMGAKANGNPLNHDRYTNGEAVAAMGVKGNANPLNHDRYTDGEAVAAMGAKGNTNPLNHDRYTNAEAVAAMGAKGNGNPLNHDRYTDGEAVSAVTAANTFATRAELLSGGAGAVHWSRLTGVPAGFADGVDNDSGGDITGVSAGTGLAGGGTTGDASLSVDFATTQRRVTGSCSVGQAVTAVNQDGTVTCTSVTAGTTADIYYRWGQATCASGDSTVMTGTAFGNIRGHWGNSTPLCMAANDPGPAYNAANHGTYLVPLATYYNGNDAVHQLPGVTTRRLIPCAVCATSRRCFRLPGTQTCPSGWTSVSSGGYLAGGYYSNGPNFEAFCYELNNAAGAAPAGLDQVFTASTGDTSYMTSGYTGYRHTKCAICCR